MRARGAANRCYFNLIFYLSDILLLWHFIIQHDEKECVGLRDDRLEKQNVANSVHFFV